MSRNNRYPDEAGITIGLSISSLIFGKLSQLPFRHETMDARHFAVVERLRNGTSVTIRSVRPDDEQRIVKAFGELERDSVYTRFFSYKRELSGTELAQLDTMDFGRDVMLVVTAGAPADEKIVASARYAGAHDDPDGKR